MGKLAAFIALFLLSAFTIADPITAQERQFAADFLSQTEKDIMDATKGLSKTQLQFKPSADQWSMEDCMKHIAMTEKGLWHMADSVIRASANPDKRSEVKMKDQQVIDMMTDRSKKFKAADRVQPQNTPFESFEEAFQSYKADRAKLIGFIRQTDTDLRNHIAAFAGGHFDSYQLILFIGAHSKRHTLQMIEVKNDPKFPKS